METNPVHLLSDREKEVFALIAKGNTNKEIGNILEITTATVETHRKHIKAKLQAKTTVDLLNIAHKYHVV